MKFVKKIHLNHFMVVTIFICFYRCLPAQSTLAVTYNVFPPWNLLAQHVAAWYLLRILRKFSITQQRTWTILSQNLY